ncbi:MAG: hypothetical protein LCH31_04470 [Actinobacteria bacterium]|nr:hypothetical protein [Actinomycetota bacterium]
MNQFEAFGFKLVCLGGEELAFILGARFELVEYLAENCSRLGGFFSAETVLPECGFDLAFDPVDHDCGTGATILLAAARAGEVLVAFALLIGRFGFWRGGVVS